METGSRSLPPLDPDAAERAALVFNAPSMRTRGLAAVRDMVEATPFPETMPPMAEIENRVIPGPYGEIPLRIYRPTADELAPVAVYFHGGGLVMGSNHSFEPLARSLAAGSGATVVAVDYRLSPEFPPPVQFDEAFAVTSWVAEFARDMRVDPSRLVVVGDSAGGTLAGCVAIAARDRGGPEISCQVLLYAGVDRDLAAPSMSLLADAPGLTRDDVIYLLELGDAGSETPTDGYQVPGYALDLSGLPAAIVVTAECDPVRDWGERYAVRLRDAGVQTIVTRYPGVYHGFLMRPDAVARGRLAMAEISAILRAKFAQPLPF